MPGLMHTNHFDPGAQWYDDAATSSILSDATYDRAYAAVSAAGHAVAAVINDVSVEAIRLRLEPEGSSYASQGCVKFGSGGAPSARVEAWAAGPVATELFCGTTGDCSGTFAFSNALDEAFALGVLPDDDDDATYRWAEHDWPAAREAAQALLAAPRARRATLTIAAHLLLHSDVPLPGEAIHRMVDEAERAVARPTAVCG